MTLTRELALAVLSSMCPNGVISAQLAEQFCIGVVWLKLLIAYLSINAFSVEEIQGSIAEDLLCTILMGVIIVDLS